MSSSIRTAPPGVYDATTLLGFGSPSPEPLPEAAPGEIVLRYGGWSLQELRDSPIVRGRNILWDQRWYNKYPWSAEKLPLGVYALRLPVPDSNRKSWGEQQRLVRPGEESAPVVLAATALLTHLVSTGERLMEGHWFRCKDRTADGNRVGLGWLVGRLRGDGWYDGPRHCVWLASARRSPSA